MEEELFEAELFDEEPPEERREKRQLNGAMGATLAVVVLFLILAATVGIPHSMMGAGDATGGAVAERFAGLAAAHVAARGRVATFRQ